MFLEQGEAFAAFLRLEMGWTTFDQGDYTRATALFRECITEHKEARWTLPSCLEGLAAVAVTQGAGERAARLWSAAEAMREATDLPMELADIPDYERRVTLSRAQIDDAIFAAAWAAGRALTLEQAIAEALNH